MVVITCLVVLTVACSDEDTPGTVTVAGKPYVDAMARGLTDHGAGDLTVTPSQARCIAPKWVNILEPERLDQAGVEPDELAADAGLDEKAARVALTEAEMSELVDAFGECDVDLTRAFVKGLTEGATIAADDERCLVEAVPEDLVRRLVAIEVTEGADAPDADAALMSELFEALSACPGAIDLGE
jgi:hypothetical protein